MSNDDDDDDYDDDYDDDDDDDDVDDDDDDDDLSSIETPACPGHLACRPSWYLCLRLSLQAVVT